MDIEIKSIIYCGGGEYGLEQTNSYSGVSADRISAYDKNTSQIILRSQHPEIFISTPAEELKKIFNKKGIKRIFVEGVRCHDGGTHYSGRIVAYKSFLGSVHYLPEPKVIEEKRIELRVTSEAFYGCGQIGGERTDTMYFGINDIKIAKKRESANISIGSSNVVTINNKTATELREMFNKRNVKVVNVQGYRDSRGNYGGKIVSYSV